MTMSYMCSSVSFSDHYLFVTCSPSILSVVLGVFDLHESKLDLSYGLFQTIKLTNNILLLKHITNERWSISNISVKQFQKDTTDHISKPFSFFYFDLDVVQSIFFFSSDIQRNLSSVMCLGNKIWLVSFMVWNRPYERSTFDSCRSGTPKATLSIERPHAAKG